MSLIELVRKRRSIRRFRQTKIPREKLCDFVDGARLAPSASNRQPLRFLVIDDPARLQQVFEHTAWAGYLDDGAPPADARPVAYVFILIDAEINPNAEWDVGIGAQTITLLALEQGVGSCLLGALQREALHKTLALPANLAISLAVALGYPAEEPVAEPWDSERDDFKAPRYFRDASGKLHVPKRALDDVLYFNHLL